MLYILIAGGAVLLAGRGLWAIKRIRADAELSFIAIIINQVKLILLLTAVLVNALREFDYRTVKVQKFSANDIVIPRVISTVFIFFAINFAIQLWISNRSQWLQHQQLGDFQ